MALEGVVEALNKIAVMMVEQNAKLSELLSRQASTVKKAVLGGGEAKEGGVAKAVTGGIGGTFKKLGKSLSGSLKGVFKSFGQMIPQLALFMLVVDPLMAMIGAFLEPLGMLTPLFEIFGSILAQLLVPIMMALMDLLMPFMPLLEAIVQLFMPFIRIFVLIIELLNPVIGLFISFSKILVNIASVITNVIGFIAEFAIRFKTFFISLLVTIIKAIVDWFGNIWDTIAKFFSDLFSGIGDWFRGIWNSIVNWINDFIDSILFYLNPLNWF
jgi:phage-related protein